MGFHSDLTDAVIQKIIHSDEFLLRSDVEAKLITELAKEVQYLRNLICQVEEIVGRESTDDIVRSSGGISEERVFDHKSR
jgi:hypothetical protein